MYHLSLIARIYPCNFVFEGVGRQDTASQVTCNNNGSVKLSMEGQWETKLKIHLCISRAFSQKENNPVNIFQFRW